MAVKELQGCAANTPASSICIAPFQSQIVSITHPQFLATFSTHFQLQCIERMVGNSVRQATTPSCASRGVHHAGSRREGRQRVAQWPIRPPQLSTTRRCGLAQSAAAQDTLLGGVTAPQAQRLEISVGGALVRRQRRSVNKPQLHAVVNCCCCCRSR
jgi:hypothetical protein